MNNGKVRIYELSKELSLDNKDILGICEQLNIAVKSHSSTITESQAERIRTFAERNLKVSGEVGTATASSGHDKVSRKPEILEIRSRKSSPPVAASHANQPSQEPSAPVATPPRLLAKPAVLKKTPQPSAPPSHGEPAKPVQEQPPQSPPSKSKTSSPQEPKPTPAVEKPQLLSPPVRPAKPAPKPQSSEPKAKPKRVVKQANQPSKGKEGRNKPSLKDRSKSPSATPSEPPKQKRPPKKAAVSAEPSGSPEVTKTTAKSAPKLQRPNRPKPPKPVSDSKPVTTEEPGILDQEEDLEVDGILDTVEKPKPKVKLKRPTPPRGVPSKKGWEEDDDDDKGKGKAGKAATKAKRPKPPVIIDDDDDDLMNLETGSAATVSVSLSVARPPKPASMTASAKPPSGARKRPKAPTKGDSSSSRSNQRERRQEKVTAKRPEEILLTGSLTVRELAETLEMAETEIIKLLFFKGMAVNITQTLDLDTATLVAKEMGVKVNTPEKTSAAAKTTEMLDEQDLEQLQRRPPVVTIMGHVDHGKTTLLDSIRKTKVAAGEAGGITQHIGAYHVDIDHEDRTEQIVFLDTPGHEAFTAMRARGTRVTDIAILVVAADDGVQPQTKEAISHAKAAKVPIVVAINKIDKPESEPDRIKQELTEQQLVPEEWGGDTIMVPVSAIQGDNLDTLLEMILLVSEIEELSANPDRPARGTVIEANLDKSRGPVATLLVQNGTLRVGDTFVAGSVFGKIRAMIDDRGEKVEVASPSFAVEVLGLNEVPSAGDEFEVYPSEKEARAVASKRADTERESRLAQTMSSRRVTLSSLSAQAQEGELKELNLILKADVQGSVEAILGSLGQLPQDEVQIRVLLADPGEVTETDVYLAAASGAVVIGFNTTLASGSRAAADQEGVDIREYNIIYNLLDDIQGAMEGLLEPEEVEESLGEVEVRAVFPVGRGAVAGCYVLNGKVLRNCRIRVRRKGQVVYEGNLDSLKRMKDDVKEVNFGYECGIGIDKFNDWKEGDIIETYQMVFKRRTLTK